MDDENLNHDHDHEACLGLGLGLGLGFTPKRDDPRKIKKRMFFLNLSIPLHQNESSLRLNDDKRQGGIGDRSKEDNDSNYANGCSRKKLRLTRDQTTLLEDSFRQHTTLNTAQKQTLAEKLNLKPRQVEVWFQNRRARTKLKQTEMDCEFLRKNCDRLSEENRRLKKELSELRSSLKLENPAAAVPLLQYHHGKSENRGGGGRGPREAAAAAVLEEKVVHN